MDIIDVDVEVDVDVEEMKPPIGLTVKPDMNPARDSCSKSLSWVKEREASKTLEGWMEFLLSDAAKHDITFLIGDGDDVERITAQKIILANASPVFERFLYAVDGGQGQEDVKQFVRLTNAKSSARAFRIFLKYIYTKKVEMEFEDCFDVLLLSTCYEMYQLTEYCVEIVKASLSVENAANIFQQSWKEVALLGLHNHVLRFILRNGKAVFTTDGFKVLSRENLCKILKSDQLLCDEPSVFAACIRWAEQKWIEENPTNQGLEPGAPAEEVRRILDPELALKLIRFPLMSNKEFKTCMKKKSVLTVEEEASVFWDINDSKVCDIGSDSSDAEGPRYKLKFSTVPRHNFKRSLESYDASANASLRKHRKLNANSIGTEEADWSVSTINPLDVEFSSVEMERGNCSNSLVSETLPIDDRNSTVLPNPEEMQKIILHTPAPSSLSSSQLESLMTADVDNLTFEEQTALAANYLRSSPIVPDPAVDPSTLGNESVRRDEISSEDPVGRTTDSSPGFEAYLVQNFQATVDGSSSALDADESNTSFVSSRTGDSIDGGRSFVSSRTEDSIDSGRSFVSSRTEDSIDGGRSFESLRNGDSTDNSRDWVEDEQSQDDHLTPELPILTAEVTEKTSQDDDEHIGGSLKNKRDRQLLENNQGEKLRLRTVNVCKTKKDSILSPLEQSYYARNFEDCNGLNYRSLYDNLARSINKHEIREIIRTDRVVYKPCATVPLILPGLEEYNINFLTSKDSIDDFVNFFETVDPSDLICYHFSHRIPQLLKDLWIKKVTTKIRINNVTMINLDHKEKNKKMVVINMTSQANEVLAGIKNDRNVKAIYIANCSGIGLERIDAQSLKRLTLCNVTVLTSYRKFLSRCTNLDEYCSTFKKLVDLELDLGLRSGTGSAAKLRKLSLGFTTLTLRGADLLPIDFNNHVEELSLDTCKINAKIEDAFNMIFPNLKKVKICRKVSCKTLYSVLQIASVEEIEIWDLIFDVKRDRKDKHFLYSKTFLEKTGLSISSDLKTCSFILRKHESAAPTTAATTALQASRRKPVITNASLDADRWKLTSFRESTSQKSELEYTEFNWHMFYDDFATYCKINPSFLN